MSPWRFLSPSRSTVLHCAAARRQSGPTFRVVLPSRTCFSLFHGLPNHAICSLSTAKQVIEKLCSPNVQKWCAANAPSEPSHHSSETKVVL